MLLESIYEPVFVNDSHGFRPRRSCHTALQEVRNTWDGVKWILEIDIEGFFDNIDHTTHGSLIFIGVLRIYNVLYFLLLEDLSIFLIVFSGLLSAKWAVVHNTIEPALEVLCSSKLNFQFLEVNFQNERTVRGAVRVL